jgi:hypothetical protein
MADDDNGQFYGQPVDVQIIRASDGKTVTYHDESYSEFMWTDGNWACDCNRGLMFRRACGEDVDITDDHEPCGDSRYYVKLPDGTMA